MTTLFTRRTAIAGALVIGVSLTATTLALASAETGPSTKRTAPTADAGTTRLQWGAVALTARQYPAMKEFAQKALGLNLVNSSEEFSVFTTPNGNLFELYGPKAPQYPWRTSPTSTAIGFDSTDLDAAEKTLQANGAKWASTVQVVPGAGADGGDYRFRLFRAPDNRVYAIAQSGTDPRQPVSDEDTGAAGINKLQWGAVALTAEQYPTMKKLAANGLGLTPLNEAKQFSVFGTENGALFELYGPKAPQYPWRASPTSIAFGFNTTNLDKAMTQLQNNGAEWVSTVQVVPGAGAGGSDYRFRLFRAPDNRVYAISQSNATS
ncbi:hypothetical protein ACFYXF_27565 [Streptomyces sp. NPDC002680]|uniref:hypothetical protein n=1 Tax=Streptomyces sp. NPDC002680 TaxID=3364659 RepID=UPI0036A6882B